MNALIEDPCIQWSDTQESTAAGAGRTVLQAVQHCGPEIRESFFEVLGRIRQRLSTTEWIDVRWWYAPLVYLEVDDLRWNHWPCHMRLLVSFDLTNGKCASADSVNEYAFARRGWRSFAREIVGSDVREYSDCGDPDKLEPC